MEDAGEDNVEFIPRNYQVALFEKCMRENTIIFLPTGAGKTFIAIMVLKRMGKDLLGENHKLSIILVNTVALVDQHTKYIKQHTPFEVAGFSGEMNVDFWNSQIWNEQLQKNQVLVMTCEILAGIVRNKIFDLNRANLLIFDECHHGVNDHSMRQIMTNFQNLAMKPRVIGLTATLLNGNCKPDRVMNEVETLEITFQSKVATLEESGDVDGYATNPKEILETFRTHTLSGVELECIKHLDTMMQNLKYFRIETEVNERIKHTSLTPLEPNDGLKKVINIVKDLKFHLENLEYMVAVFVVYHTIFKLKV
ncbi:hypothetical protein WA026_019669 [Henosepilachna vigintioctopunctata]|uniref:Helicase ATP-binding domain-containing protein n=1 Tax=Henosepilachna vigintioctopunctata TaxID=420089 RepID=A0AAW1UQ95_9CUCU